MTVFWGYDTAQRHVFSSEAHGIGSSFAQRHSYQKYFKILKARGTESAQSLWCMEFYFISHNMSQWGWVISNHQLVNGSKSISISNDSKTEAAHGIIDRKVFSYFYWCVYYTSPKFRLFRWTTDLCCISEWLWLPFLLFKYLWPPSKYFIWLCMLSHTSSV